MENSQFKRNKYSRCRNSNQADIVLALSRSHSNVVVAIATYNFVNIAHETWNIACALHADGAFIEAMDALDCAPHTFSQNETVTICSVLSFTLIQFSKCFQCETNGKYSIFI